MLRLSGCRFWVCCFVCLFVVCCIGCYFVFRFCGDFCCLFVLLGWSGCVVICLAVCLFVRFCWVGCLFWLHDCLHAFCYLFCGLLCFVALYVVLIILVLLYCFVVIIICLIVLYYDLLCLDTCLCVCFTLFDWFVSVVWCFVWLGGCCCFLLGWFVCLYLWVCWWFMLCCFCFWVVYLWLFIVFLCDLVGWLLVVTLLFVATDLVLFVYFWFWCFSCDCFVCLDFAVWLFVLCVYRLVVVGAYCVCCGLICRVALRLVIFVVCLLW